jgi:hypothetical protein
MESPPRKSPSVLARNMRNGLELSSPKECEMTQVWVLTQFFETQVTAGPLKFKTEEAALRHLANLSREHWVIDDTPAPPTSPGDHSNDLSLIEADETYFSKEHHDLRAEPLHD